MAGKAAAAVLQLLPTPPTSQGSIPYPTIYTLLAPRFPVCHLEAFGPSQDSWFVWQRFHSHGGYPVYSSRTVLHCRALLTGLSRPSQSWSKVLFPTSASCSHLSRFLRRGHLLPATSIFDPGLWPTRPAACLFSMPII